MQTARQWQLRRAANGDYHSKLSSLLPSAPVEKQSFVEGEAAEPDRLDRSLVCASPGYLAALGEPRHPEELARHHAVIYARRDEDANTRWVFSREGERCEVEVAVRAVMRDGIGVIDAAVGGCGFAPAFRACRTQRVEEWPIARGAGGLEW